MALGRVSGYPGNEILFVLSVRKSSLGSGGVPKDHEVVPASYNQTLHFPS